MKPAALPPNEVERLQKLRYYDILDTTEEELFDNVAKLASYICGVPIALVSLIDENRQWFKARVGLEVKETDRNVAFCAHAILNNEPFIINDSRKDDRFFDNPLVVGEPNVVFYAGYPLETEDDFRLGTLCVIDHVPRTLTSEQSSMMKFLAKQTIHLIKMREVLKVIENERENATQANAAKRDFIAAISHDIRNPLNSLMGISSMLEATELNKEQIDYVKQFKNSGEVILKIVNDVIYLSQLESNQINLENHLFSIKRTMIPLKEFYQMETKKKGVTFEVTIEDGVRDFYIGDERKFEKIIWNLTANAVKFTTHGKIGIHISLDTAPNVPNIILRIYDTGPGISKNVLPNLFQKYNTFTPTDCQISGSGLGLSIVKLATEAMGGKIEVRSILGVGTEFIVTLPLKYGSSEPEKILKETILTKEVLKEKFNNVPILISDDNEMNRIVLKSYLNGLGFIVTETSDGNEAFKLASNQDFKLLFLDIEIPGMIGTELSLRLREIGKKGIHIACTGLCMPEEKSQILKSGFQYFLPKPYIKNELYSILDSILSES